MLEGGVVGASAGNGLSVGLRLLGAEGREFCVRALQVHTSAYVLVHEQRVARLEDVRQAQRTGRPSIQDDSSGDEVSLLEAPLEEAEAPFVGCSETCSQSQVCNSVIW